jgi:hypothetical protein
MSLEMDIPWRPNPEIHNKIQAMVHKLESVPVYERFRAALSDLCGTDLNFFSVLSPKVPSIFRDLSGSENRKLASQRRLEWLNYYRCLDSLGKTSLGFGIGMGSMAMANLVGSILRFTESSKELDDLTRGEKIFSIAISEPGWKGKITNIQTSLQKNRGDQRNNSESFLFGTKGFATNGRVADCFLVLAKEEESFSEGENFGGQSFLLVRIYPDDPGLRLEPFDLDYAQEATHAKLFFDHIPVPENRFLRFPYKDHAKSLQYLEGFSFQILFLSRIREIGSRDSSVLFQNQEWTEILKEYSKVLREGLEVLVTRGITGLGLRDLRKGKPLIEYLSRDPKIQSRNPELGFISYMLR